MEAVRETGNVLKTSAGGAVDIGRTVAETAVEEANAIFRLLRSFVTSLPFLFAVASLILVSVWASKDGPNWLGIPSWETNIFPWHPVLMTAGFYFSQVLALLSWHCDIMPTQAASMVSWQRFFHVFWNSAAMATLIAALYAVFKYRARIHIADLSTTHEWTGILIATLFLCQYLLGLFFTAWRTATVYHGGLGNHTPEQNAATLRKIGTMRRFHKFTGIFILLLTTANILSGIVQRQLNCAYVRQYNADPAYGGFDMACRLSNGLGVLIWMTTFFTILAVLSRYDFQPKDIGTHSNSEALIDRDIVQHENTEKGGMYEGVKAGNADEGKEMVHDGNKSTML